MNSVSPAQGKYYNSYWSRRPSQDAGYTNPALRKIYSKWIGSGSKCLDYGCGDGTTSGHWLVKNGCEYTGVDVSSVARERAKKSGLTVQEISGEGGLPFATGSFDNVVCIEVVEHLIEPQVVFKELYRVLRPGGVLLATTPNTAFWRRRLDYSLLGRWNPCGDAESLSRPWRDPHIRFFTCQTFKAFLRECGFTDVALCGYGGGFLPFVPYIGRLATHIEGRAGISYRTLENLSPAVFAMRLCAIGVKPLSA